MGPAGRDLDDGISDGKKRGKVSERREKDERSKERRVDERCSGEASSSLVLDSFSPGRELPDSVERMMYEVSACRRPDKARNSHAVLV